MKFHENLRFLMDAKGIQIKELASKAGISENTVKTYLRSASAEPKLSKAIAIAKALDTTVEDLCDENSKYSYDNLHFTSVFSALSENDKKSVLVLMKEMTRHYAQKQG
ncbi:MAG: helix-turn-helix transcriptional regulator [Treponema sp.]|nr:helix-turn-helix transcriptional regulator [Treponema sp.]